MTSRTEALERALDAGTNASGTSHPWTAYAAELVALRRRVLEEPACPTSLLRRLQSLYDPARVHPVGRLLSLVFDSRREAAPAFRGASRPRELRYESGEDALEVQVVAETPARFRLLLAVEPPRPGLRIRVEAADVDPEPVVRLDAASGGEVSFESHATQASLAVIDAEGEVLRIPSVPLG